MKMNSDVIKHIIKMCHNEMKYCKIGILIHKGGKEDAIATYERIISMLEDLNR